MISKELLSEVINIKIEDIIDLKIFGKDLKYYEKCLLKSCCDGRLSDNKDSIRKSINIYELAHKCKEWAYSQGYILFSKIRLNSSLASCYFDTMGKHDYEDDYHNDFRADTEPEAIFKACQWILESKKEGN